MSEITKDAIFSRLESDLTLVSLLASANGRPAIDMFWTGPNPNVSPQLLLRVQESTYSEIHDISGVIKYEEWEFQPWAKTRGSVHLTIMERIEKLFHEKHFSLTDDNSANLKYMRKIGGMADGFDRDTEMRFCVGLFALEYSLPQD